MAAAAGIGVPLLAACGDDGGSTATETSTGSSTPSEAGSSSAPASESASSGGGVEGLASTSDIEVGGGTIFADEQVVITQPSEGDFKAFTSTCTHQGCQVNDVSDGTINCPCHGSSFSIEDGSPQGGPASSPLEEVAISVEGDQIVLA